MRLINYAMRKSVPDRSPVLKNVDQPLSHPKDRTMMKEKKRDMTDFSNLNLTSKFETLNASNEKDIIIYVGSTWFNHANSNDSNSDGTIIINFF